jgi:hypothetical protein
MSFFDDARAPLVSVFSLSGDLATDAARIVSLENAYLVDKYGGIAELSVLLEAIEH